MVPHYSRSGFTLVEMMIASSISTMVLITIATTFIFCQRTFRSTMADAEMTLALREIRDKLLFHAGPGLDEGLLTGVAQAKSSAITMNWTTDKNGFGNGPDKVKLVLKNDDNGSYFINEGLADSETAQRWFCPNGFRLQGNWSATVDLPRIQIDMGSTQANDVRGKTWILLPQ